MKSNPLFPNGILCVCPRKKQAGGILLGAPGCFLQKNRAKSLSQFHPAKAKLFSTAIIIRHKPQKLKGRGHPIGCSRRLFILPSVIPWSARLVFSRPPRALLDSPCFPLESIAINGGCYAVATYYIFFGFIAQKYTNAAWMGIKRPQVRLLSLGPENGLKLRFQAIFLFFQWSRKTIKIAVKNGRCYGVATFFGKGKPALRKFFHSFYEGVRLLIYVVFNIHIEICVPHEGNNIFGTNPWRWQPRGKCAPSCVWS